MADMFQFTVLVNETDEVEVSIPQMLHRQVSSMFVGTMERMEFGFHFFETMERDFPTLHGLILQAIDNQLRMDGDSVYYSLCSNWFEDEES